MTSAPTLSERFDTAVAQARLMPGWCEDCFVGEQRCDVHRAVNPAPVRTLTGAQERTDWLYCCACGWIAQWVGLLSAAAAAAHERSAGHHDWGWVPIEQPRPRNWGRRAVPGPAPAPPTGAGVPQVPPPPPIPFRPRRTH